MRSNMTSHVQNELRARIVRGQLAGRINEVHIAQDLGVSRTPLREALSSLAGEALVEARPKLGFYVRPASPEELAQLYAIRARLDPWALELAGLPGSEALGELGRINAELARARDADASIDLDDRFHLLLLAGCPNQVLLDLIRQMIVRTRRYEHVYFSDRANRTTAATQHERLLAKLRRKDLAGACEWLRTNMSTTVEKLR